MEIKRFANPFIEFVVYFVVIALFFSFLKGCDKADEQAGLLRAMSDSLKTYQTEQGLWQSERLVLSGNVEQLQSMVGVKDSMLSALAKKVTEKSLSHTGVKIVVHDTVYVSAPDSTVYAAGDSMPTYYYSGNSKWLSWSAKAGSRQFVMNYTTFEELSIDVAWKKRGLFKAEPVVTAHSNNPRSIITDLRVVQVQQNPSSKYWIAGAGAGGIALGFLLRSLISK